MSRFLRFLCVHCLRLTRVKLSSAVDGGCPGSWVGVPVLGCPGSWRRRAVRNARGRARYVALPTQRALGLTRSRRCLPRASARRTQRRGPGRNPCVPAATARLPPRRLSRDGGDQDSTLRRLTACASASSCHSLNQWSEGSAAIQHGVCDPALAIKMSIGIHPHLAAAVRRIVRAPQHDDAVGVDRVDRVDRPTLAGGARINPQPSQCPELSGTEPHCARSR